MKKILALLVLITGFACQVKENFSPTNLAYASEQINEKKPQTLITIAAVGDIMLGSPFPNESRMPPNDGADLLKPAQPILQSADIAFGNLEGPLADGGISSKCGTRRARCFAFRMPTRYARYLKEAGFDVLSLANNHAGDFGDQGRASTRQTLDQLGIKHAGSDASQFASTILEVKGKKIGFIAFAHNNVSLNVNDLKTASLAVANLKKSVDILVVSFHGGAEGADRQRVPKQTEIFLGEARGNLPLFARTVIDSGADLVLGHGPHVLRGMEIYKKRLIAYSQLQGPTAETMILEVTIDEKGEFVKGKIHPFRLEGRGILKVDESKSAIKTIRYLSDLDFKDSAPRISDDGTILP